MFSAFFAALAQMSDPRFRAVLIKGIGLTFLLLAALYALVFFGVSWMVPDTFTLPWIGEVTFVDTLLSWGSVLLMMVLSIFLMVPVASAFTGIFLDEVADAVEARHYPNLGPPHTMGLTDNIRESLGFLAILIAANAAALVLYVTPVAPFVFFGLNGFLLGREYFRMVAVRRIARSEASQVFRRNLPMIWIAGAAMAVPLTIPLLNLVVPILGAAAFTHIYHKTAR